MVSGGENCEGNGMGGEEQAPKKHNDTNINAIVNPSHITYTLQEREVHNEIRDTNEEEQLLHNRG